MADYNIADSLMSRLATVAAHHSLGTAESLAEQFVAEGLKAYQAPEGSVTSQLAFIVNQQGYSSVDEAVEHLLTRGLHEYEEGSLTRQEAEARVQGLGHID